MALASSYFDRAGGERPGGEPMSLKLLRDAPFGVVLCLVGTNYINSSNAQQTDQQIMVPKAEGGARHQDQVRGFQKEYQWHLD
jgi:hypothetical protein